MPIYKISKFERDEWRGRLWHGRLRLAAMIVSALMLAGTLALWIARELARSAPVVTVPAVKVIDGAAAIVGGGADGR